MTRRSPRAPKLKEAEVGEGSSPGTARQLEFSTKVEPSSEHQLRRNFPSPLHLATQRRALGQR
jgi:hypothetical protein